MGLLAGSTVGFRLGLGLIFGFIAVWVVLGACGFFLLLPANCGFGFQARRPCCARLFWAVLYYIIYTLLDYYISLQFTSSNCTNLTLVKATLNPKPKPLNPKPKQAGRWLASLAAQLHWSPGSFPGPKHQIPEPPKNFPGSLEWLWYRKKYTA